MAMGPRIVGGTHTHIHIGNNTGGTYTFNFGNVSTSIQQSSNQTTVSSETTDQLDQQQRLPIDSTGDSTQ